MRTKRDDIRPAPTKNPNSHYICELIFKHFRAIIAAIVLILSLFILSFSQLDDNVTEIIKSVMFLSAGFLFGNIK